jgi:hypothetical protein
MRKKEGRQGVQGKVVVVELTDGGKLEQLMELMGQEVKCM